MGGETEESRISYGRTDRSKLVRTSGGMISRRKRREKRL